LKINNITKLESYLEKETSISLNGDVMSYVQNPIHPNIGLPGSFLYKSIGHLQIRERRQWSEKQLQIV
jgi:hypothetical protein